MLEQVDCAKNIFSSILLSRNERIRIDYFTAADPSWNLPPAAEAEVRASDVNPM